MNNYRGKWTKKVTHDNLQDIDINVEPGEVLMVVGSVGSGKTCLLYSLLNEIEQVSGSCCINGRISYAPQDTWCFGGTLQQNILMGNDMNHDRYQTVIDVCGLERDIRLFEFGDQTFVGEKGSNLSGGQKARVCLARAVYNQADYYLLDDPLSAVDAHIGNHIVDKCIKQYLKGMTIVLVTHQLQFLKQADKIAFLKDGKLIAYGSYEALIQDSTEFIEFLDKRKAEEENKESQESIAGDMSLSADIKEDVSNGVTDTTSMNRRTSGSSVLSRKMEEGVKEKQDVDRRETMTSGAVNRKIYWQYFRSGGSVLLIFFAAIFSLTSQALSQFSDLWLASWTQAE